MPAKSSSGEVVLRIDLSTKEVQPLVEMSLESAGLRERDDLQRWIADYPEVIGPDLLLITSEFDWFALGDRKVSDRLDLLFLDSRGQLLVAELKRDKAEDTVDMQALKYAAYCSTLTVEDTIEEFSRFHEVDVVEARRRIEEHAPSVKTEELGQVRIRLVAGSFGPAVTSVALWLQDIGLDIGCIQVVARRTSDTEAVISARQLLPLPVVEEFMVRRRRRAAEEVVRERTTRRRNAATVILESAALAPGTELTLHLPALTAEWREQVEKVLETEPSAGKAEWTGISLRKALKWKRDGSYYSASGLVEALLTELGFSASVPGPQYWVTPDGTTLADLAISIEPDVSQL